MRPTRQRRTGASGDAGERSNKRSTFGAAQAKDHLRQSRGRPLAAGIRQAFEPLLGVDLRSVLVHDDEHARAAALGLRVPAFAHKAHIAFAGAAPQWRSGRGREIWAHEIAHTAQYLSTGHTGAVDQINRYGDPAESDARRAAMALIRNEPYALGGGPTGEIAPVLDLIVDGATAAYNAVEETVDDAIEWTADQLRDLLPEEVLQLAEGGEAFIDMVKDWIEGGFSEWLEGLLSQVSFVDAIQPFFEAIGQYAADFNTFGDTISETAGEALAPLFEPIAEALSTWINPALERRISTLQSEEEAQEAIDEELFQQDAENIQGVVDAIAAGAESIWDTIEEFLRSIPGAEEAWEWLRDGFDFVVDAARDIADWVMERASEVWEWISEAIEPIRPALELIAKILFILSPLGPIYLLMEYGPPIWEAITGWFSSFNLGDILQQHLDDFTENVLPTFQTALRAGASVLAAGVELLLPVIDAMIAGAEELGGVEIEWLQVLRVFLNWAASEARKLAKLTDEQIKAVMDAAILAFNALIEFLGKIIDFFVRLAMVALNPLMLPVAITGVLWLLLPDAFKPPIIDFILNLIIVATMDLPEDLFGLGPLGPAIKGAMVAFLMSLKEGGNLDEIPKERRADAATQRKINATNKIAAIAAGGGVLFVAGYFVGLLEGLWTGISEPFVLIWDLISFVFTAVTKLLQFVHRMGEQMFEGGASQGSDPDLASARSDMSAEEQAAFDSAMAETEGEARDGQQGTTPSEETLDELRQSEEAGANIEAEFEGSRDEASSTQGVDVERIMNWLWSIRTRLREGARSLGRQLAEAVYDFIEQSDFQLGRSVGNVAGQILFEVILGIITAGGWTALTAAKPFIKAGAKIARMLKRTIRPLIRLIRRLRGPVGRGLSSIGDVLRQIPGMRRIIDRIEDAMRRMMRYVDEFDAPRRSSSRPNTPDPTPDRSPNRSTGDGRGQRDGRSGRDGHDERSRRRERADPNDDSPNGRRRRLRAAHSAIRRRFRRGLFANRARAEARAIATRYRIPRVSLRDVGSRFRLRLQINPKLDRFFNEEELGVVRERARELGISERSIAERLTELWRAALRRSRSPTLAGRRAYAYRAARRGVGGGPPGYGGPRQLFRSRAVAPHLRTQESASGLGQRFEDSVVSLTMGPTQVPRGPGRTGFDVDHVAVSPRAGATEAKRGALRASTTRSAANSASAIASGATFAIDSPQAGSPIAAHLAEARAVSPAAEAAAADNILQQHLAGNRPTTGTGGNQRVVENQVSAITTNLAANLGDLERRYVAFRAAAQGSGVASLQDREAAARAHFRRIRESGQIVIRLALNVATNQTLLNSVAQGDTSHTELAATVALLRAQIVRMRAADTSFGAQISLVVAAVTADNKGVATAIGPDLPVATF